ncbi:MAG: hypothetical protein ACAI35_22465 [Candidatus Methylacidiphilales bacterium]
MKAGYLIAVVAVVALALYIVKARQDRLGSAEVNIRPISLDSGESTVSKPVKPQTDDEAENKRKERERKIAEDKAKPKPAPAPPVYRDRSDVAENLTPPPTVNPDETSNGDTSMDAAPSTEPTHAAAPAAEPAKADPQAVPETAQAVPPPATTESSYNPPDTTKILFNAESLPLSPDDRSSLATATADYVRGMNGNSGKNAETAARFLGIALRLDPRNRNAIITNGQLRRGAATTLNDPKFSPQAFAKQLIFAIKSLKNAGDENSGKLAVYLIDMAAMVDPSNEDAVFFAESATTKPDWAAIVPPAAAATATSPATHPDTATTSGPAPLKREKAVIKTLVVQDSATGAQTASTTEITVTATAAEAETQFILPATASEDAQIASDIARYYVNTRSLASRVKAKVTVTMPAENAKLPNAAAMALTLGIVSVLEDVELDPGFAVTGDLTSQGATERANWMTSKINGAADKACTILAVPKANEAEISDAVLLSSVLPLLRTQVFAVANVDEALAIARKDRAPSLQKAIDQYSALVKELDGNTTPSNLAKVNAVTKLKEIVQLASNHLSAKYLLDLASGTAPKTLTRRTSIEQIFEVARPLLQIYSPLPPGPTYHFPASEYSRAENGLQARAKIISPDCEELLFSVKSIIASIENMDTLHSEVPAMRQAAAYVSSFPNDVTRRNRVTEIDRKRIRTVEILQKLNPDPEILKQLWR